MLHDQIADQRTEDGSSSAGNYELLMILQPVPEEVITEIVDEIFLRLVRKRP